jgi:hypothetical protein
MTGPGFTVPGARRFGREENFHLTVATLVRDGGVQLDPLRRGVLAPWEHYRVPLAIAGVEAGEVRRLRAEYLELTEPAPVAAVATLDSELQARDPAEFMALLLLLRQRAGVQGTKLAERAGLSTSQLYSITDPERGRAGKVPTRGGQVRSLVIACGLAPDAVTRVMRLWEEIRAPGPSRPAGAVMVTGVHHRAGRTVITPVRDRDLLDLDRLEMLVKRERQPLEKALVRAGLSRYNEFESQWMAAQDQAVVDRVGAALSRAAEVGDGSEGSERRSGVFEHVLEEVTAVAANALTGEIRRAVAEAMERVLAGAVVDERGEVA